MKITKVIILILLVLLLTIITEVGGIILLFSIPIFRLIDRKQIYNWVKPFLKFFSFFAIYLAFSFFILPLIAKPFDRVPLTGIKNVKPLNYWTIILNRHYVKPELKTLIKSSFEKFIDLHPNSTISYLDACFPIGNIPLIPHLSHKDGKKLDLAFFYLDKKTNEELNRKAPSVIGYGVFEDPFPNEINKPKECKDMGYWQYRFLETIVPQNNKENMIFDLSRTKDLIKIIATDKLVNKIFIEPHLKIRLGLTDFEKIRYQGCHSVRHDDHIHIQIN